MYRRLTDDEVRARIREMANSPRPGIHNERISKKSVFDYPSEVLWISSKIEKTNSDQGRESYAG